MNYKIKSRAQEEKGESGLRILLKTDRDSVRTVPLSISLEGKIKGGEVELKGNQATIGALLEELSKRHPGEKVMSTESEINPSGPFEYLVMVNDGDWEYLSECLEVKLRDGDRVAMAMGLRMAGGG